jgi:hypothetical protein
MAADEPPQSRFQEAIALFEWTAEYLGLGRHRQAAVVEERLTSSTDPSTRGRSFVPDRRWAAFRLERNLTERSQRDSIFIVPVAFRSNTALGSVQEWL